MKESNTNSGSRQVLADSELKRPDTDVATNDEQLLLLFAALELDESGMQSLQSRIDSDMGLASRLDLVVKMNVAIDATFYQIEATSALDRSGRSMARCVQIARDHAQSGLGHREAECRPRHIPRWIGPLAAAAAIAIGLSLWLIRDADFESGPLLTINNDVIQIVDNVPMFASAEEFDTIAATFDSQDMFPESNVEEIEEQFGTLMSLNLN